jgi:hypothetical protein
MNYALGSNRALYGRKRNLITSILILRSREGLDGWKSSAKGYDRKSLEELKQIWAEEYKRGVQLGIIKSKGE